MSTLLTLHNLSLQYPHKVIFKEVTFTHVPRELNKLADAQVNEALDAHLGKSKK